MSLVALLLALAAAPDAGSGPFDWKVPSAIAVVPVGEGFQRDSMPMTIYLARTKMDLDEALVHYAQRFADAGFFIPARMRPVHGLKLPRVIALDTENMVSFLVYGWPEPDGTCTLVLGSADLKGRKSSKGSGELPAFPGATSVTSFNLESATALSFVARAQEAEVIDYYRSVLPTLGWKEREAGVFVKGPRAVRVLAKKDKAAGLLGVVLLEQPDQLPLAHP